MTTTGRTSGMGWGGRILVGFVLVLIGAAAAVWGLARSDEAARILGVVEQPAPRPQAAVAGVRQPAARPQPASANDADRIAELERRLAAVENASQQAAGSAGRADSLLIAVAARRAIDRGVALGYLERPLTERFGSAHRTAVATIVTGSRTPVRLEELVAEYDALGPALRRGGPGDGWWEDFKRELGSIVSVHSASRPAQAPDARYARAMRRLEAGDVDQALAETMRMPGAASAEAWIAKARRYIAVHRALDQIETAALMPQPAA